MADAKLKITLNAYDKTGKAFSRVNKNLGNMRRSVGNLKFAMAGIAGALAVKELVDASVSMEKMTLGMQGATGSAADGAKEFTYLNEVVDRLHLDLRSAGEAFTLLTAASRGTALAGQDTRDIFEAVAASSMVMGRSAEDTAGSLYAIQQMISKGKVTSEELRRQLGDRLPGAFKLAARAMEMTESQLDSAMRKGEVFASDFLPKFAQALKDEYGGSLADAAKTTQAKLNDLSNAIFKTKVALANSGIIEVIKEMADTMIELSQSEGLSTVIDDLGKTIISNKENIIGFFELSLDLAMKLANASVGVASFFGGITTAVSDMATAQGLYAAGAIATPSDKLAAEWKAASDEGKDLLRLQRELTDARQAYYNIANSMKGIMYPGDVKDETDALQSKVDSLEKRVREKRGIIAAQGITDSWMSGSNNLEERNDQAKVEKKRALDKVALAQEKFRDSKAYQAFLLRMGGETAAIQKRYDDGIAMAKQAYGVENAEYKKQAAWLKNQRSKELDNLETKNNASITALIESQLSEVEVIEKAYADKQVIIKNADNLDAEIKSDQLARAERIYEADLEAFYNAEASKTAKAREEAEKQRQDSLGIANANVEGFSAMWDEYVDDTGSMYDQMEQMGDQTFMSMESSLNNFLETGKISFKDFADGVIKDILRIATRMMLIQGVNMIFGVGGGSTASGANSQSAWDALATLHANGDAFNSAGMLQKYATGGIVSSPTLFQHAGGMGVMGEAGAEAIMPLTRVNGKLGVASSGGGAMTVQQHITVDARGSDISEADLRRAVAEGANQGYQKVYTDFMRRGAIRRMI